LEVLRFRLMVQRGLGRTSHKHQWEKRSMKHYAGLDVSVKETSLCILDETGKVCRELKVTSHPDDLVQVLRDPAWRLERVGLEAGPLSQWLYSGLAAAGLPVICIETRHTKAFLKAQGNKTDRNDARGIAQMMGSVALICQATGYGSRSDRQTHYRLCLAKLMQQSPLRSVADRLLNVACAMLRHGTLFSPEAARRLPSSA
jgi:Transposase